MTTKKTTAKNAVAPAETKDKGKAKGTEAENVTSAKDAKKVKVSKAK